MREIETIREMIDVAQKLDFKVDIAQMKAGVMHHSGLNEDRAFAAITVYFHTTVGKDDEETKEKVRPFSEVFQKTVDANDCFSDHTKESNELQALKEMLGKLEAMSVGGKH